MKFGSDLREIYTISISELKDTTCKLLFYTGNLMILNGSATVLVPRLWNDIIENIGMYRLYMLLLMSLFPSALSTMTK